ncbi:MAG: TfoX/Sxy family protein, partial [Bacteroidota bacterium]
MHYNETLADRIRAALADVKNVEEKNMMGGLTFMVNKKMCLGILKDDLMVRLGPDAYDAALE